MAEATQSQGRETLRRAVIRTDDAGQLPTGSWVNRQDGRLYRSLEGHSLISIQSKNLQEFERLSENPYEADDALRIMSARVDVTPQF